MIEADEDQNASTHDELHRDHAPHRLRCQRGGSLSRISLTAGGAVSFIRISIGARSGGVKKFALRASCRQPLGGCAWKTAETRSRTTLPRRAAAPAMDWPGT